MTSGADLDAVNLARRLTDGEQVRIPGPGDPAPPLPPGAAAPTPGVTPSAPLDLNTATIEQLDALPGVGEVTAGHILAYRSAQPAAFVDRFVEALLSSEADRAAAAAAQLDPEQAAARYRRDLTRALF